MSEIQVIHSLTSLAKGDKEVQPYPVDETEGKTAADNLDPGPIGKSLDLSVRPEIDYSSLSAFFSSFLRRFKSLWTRRFVFCLLAGQLVSLCITCTNVTTTELVMRGFTIPTTQTWFLYFSLFCIYTPFTMYQYGFKGWLKMLFRDGWKYAILGVCDVEGNYFVVKAYQYTTILSCMLLDAWAIPICVFFSWLLMRTKYHWTQLMGVLICIGGLGMLVGSDHISKNQGDAAVDMTKGDLFMILGSTFYGFTNALEEFFVRQSPLYEVVGQLGMWGTIINGIQAAALEHKDIPKVPWTGAVIGLLFAYTAAMFILYTTAPILYRLASSAYFNLALLSSDFFGLLFGLFLFHYSPYWLYFVSFAVVISGLITYFWHATPESQGRVDPRRPSYVRQVVSAAEGASDVEVGGADSASSK